MLNPEEGLSNRLVTYPAKTTSACSLSRCQCLVATLCVGVAERVSDAEQQRLRLGGEWGVYWVEAVYVVDGDRALPGTEAAFRMQQLPRMARLVLGAAEGILPWI